jgi:hypothetical protein
MFHDVVQNEDEWFDLRAGKVTGSIISKAMANFGKAFGEPAKKAAGTIALEQIKGGRLNNSITYSNADMDRGHEQEPIARALYEQRLFCSVTNGGFFDNGDTGCSPDGLVGNIGMIEIKSVIGTQQISTIERDSYDPSYKWQIIHNLKETDREWLDYLSYSADFPVGKQLFIHRVHAEDLYPEFRKIDERLEQFRELIEMKKERILAQ